MASLKVFVLFFYVMYPSNSLKIGVLRASVEVHCIASHCIFKCMIANDRLYDPKEKINHIDVAWLFSRPERRGFGSWLVVRGLWFCFIQNFSELLGVSGLLD